ncbi:hypothetical protein [Croceimicrobium sp.]|uniref:hypothetical protein n=1 Tax=Croceimicrobium sp. TaxID=2828340 RepID=UPI003BAB2196
MRRTLFLNLFVIALLFTSCEGSEVYRGKWKALNAEGLKSEIVFTGDEMTIHNEDGDLGSWEYSQNSVHLENGKKEYGIQLENGLAYRILFPISDNQERGVVTDQNGQIIFIIGRSKYYSYQEVFGLN